MYNYSCVRQLQILEPPFHIITKGFGAGTAILQMYELHISLHAGKSLAEMKQEQARSKTVPSPVHLEVDDCVKVNHLGVNMYGTLKWLGDLPERGEMAGIEMVSTKHACSIVAWEKQSHCLMVMLTAFYRLCSTQS